MQFPNGVLLTILVEKNKLVDALEGLAEIVATSEDGPLVVSLMKEYLKCANVLPPSKLRNAVFARAFNDNLLRHEAVENQWLLAYTYGAQNRRVVCDYFNGLQKFFHVKMQRLLLQMASDSGQHLDPAEQKRLEKVFDTMLDSSFRDIIEPEWLKAIQRKKTAFSRVLAPIAAAHIPGSPVSKLREVFPQVCIRRAKFLLSMNSFEETLHMLLLNPEAGKQHPRVLKLDNHTREERRTVRTRDFQKRVKDVMLLQELLESEPEDEFCYPTSGLSDAEKRLEAQEELLWNYYNKSPKLFSRSARFTKSRLAMKQHTGWTDEQIEGWAIVLQRDPKRLNLYSFKYGLASRGRTQNVAVDSAESEKKHLENCVRVPRNPASNSSKRSIKPFTEKRTPNAKTRGPKGGR